MSLLFPEPFRTSQGKKTKLDQALQDLIRSESLEGDNQYRCPGCADSLQDAERRMEIRKLPPVLHFNIMRFVFDPHTWERKKTNNVIEFPMRVDMNKYLAPDAREGGELWYELRGIVEHKGTSAYHGHFISSAKEPR